MTPFEILARGVEQWPGKPILEIGNLQFMDNLWSTENCRACKDTDFLFPVKNVFLRLNERNRREG